ncbi:MAG TPA: AI-2E family transporter [Pirellulales bacterium]|nr:AI-2E family transporter [Pirellulales bacterium]
MNRVISVIVLLVLVLLFGGLFYLVVFRFFVPLFLAALFAMLFQPLHGWIMHRCHGHDRIAATLSTLAILLIVLVPTVIVVYQGAHDAVHLMRGTGRVHFETQSFDRLVEQVNSWFSLQLDPKEIREGLGTKINEWLAPIATKTPTVLLDFLIGCFVFILALYYFLADGQQMLNTVMKLIPLEQHHQQRLIDEFEEISRAVVGAHLVGGLVIAIMAGIGFSLAGVKSVFLLMMLTFLGSMVPIVGSASVWVTVCAWLAFVDERILAAIVLGAYCLALVTVVDSFLKPMLLHGQSKLNPLLAVLSVLGGVEALGPIGVFVGPMAVAFLQVGLNMLQTQLEDLSEPAKQATGPPRRRK